LKMVMTVLLAFCMTVLSAVVPQEEFRASLSLDQQQYLDSLDTITVLFDPGWAPIEYVNTLGSPSGYAKEYLDIIGTYTGLHFEPVYQHTWHEGLQKLFAGEIDMASSVSPTEQRERLLVFTKPYLTIPVVLVAGHSVGYIGDLSELENEVVAVVEGYPYAEWIMADYPQLTLRPVSNVEEGLRLVEKGKVFGFVESLLVVNHYLTSMGLTSSIKVVGKTAYENTLSMAVGTHLTPLVPILEKALDTISLEDRKSFYEKHMPLRYELRLNRNAILLIFGFSFVVLLVLAIWIVVLLSERRKREMAEQEKENIREDFRHLFESSPIPMGRLGLDGTVLGANKAWFSLFGYAEKEIPNLDLWFAKAYPDHEYRKTVQERWNKALHDKDTSLIESDEYYVTTKSGDTLILEISGTILQDYVLVSFIDITKLKQSLVELEELHQQAERSRMIILSALEDQKDIQHSLAQSKATLDAAINSMTDGVCICDPDGRFILYNRAYLAYYRLADLMQEPATLQDLSSYIEAYHENGNPIPLKQWVGMRALRGERGNDEYRLVKKGSKERWIGSYSYGPILNAQGTLLGAVVVCRDITQVKAAEQTLRYQRNHDYLTGLYSRVYIEHELQHLRNEIPLTIGIVDINGLKVLNDSFGNEMGDAILKKTAQLMIQCADTRAILGRYGGDEFIFILPSLKLEAAQAFVQRMEELAKDVCVEAYHLSLSFGYAVRTDSKETVQQTLRRAEDVLGRNKIYESASEKNKAIALVINSLFAKSNRESQHSKRVSSLCAFLAKKLELSQQDVNRMRIAGLVHDIGKIGVNESILNKPGTLDMQEWEAIKRHPEIGFRILSSSAEYNDLALAVLEHHERWDGTGYPRGLKGEQASLQARIIMIADSFDAMTSERSYKKPMSKDDAIAEIKRCSGTHYDPMLVNLFVSCIDEFSQNNEKPS